MLAPFKVLLLSFAVIIIFLFSAGIINLKADGYACAGGWDTAFREKVEVFHYGFVHLYAVPFTRECDPDRRYDPDDVEACQDTGFCTLPEDTTPDQSESE